MTTTATETYTIMLEDYEANPSVYPPRSDWWQIDGQTIHYCTEMLVDADDPDGNGHIDTTKCQHHCGGIGATGWCAYVSHETHECQGPGCPHYRGECDCPELMRGE